MSEPYGQQPGQPPAGYGQPYPASGQQPYPGDPYGGYGPRPAGPPPPDVQKAFWLELLSLALAAVTILLFMISNRAELLADAAREQPPLSPADLDTVFLIAVVIAMVITLVVLGVLLLFAFKMRAGRNWARIVLTVLGGLGIVAGLAGLGQTARFLTAGGAGTILGVVSILQLVLTIAVIFFMFRPAANTYFR